MKALLPHRAIIIVVITVVFVKVLVGPGSGRGWVYGAGSGCSDGRLHTEVIGVLVGLARLHSNLESGFKKTKQEKMPPP